MLRYGRTAEEWDALESAGWEFLVSQARLRRTTSYTEMNTVLGRRTGVREFDFGLDGERHAMGELLGQLSERSLAQAGLLISVLVQYLKANDAGPGFYDLARRKKLLPSRSSEDQKLTFWVGTSTPSAPTPGEPGRSPGAAELRGCLPTARPCRNGNPHATPEQVHALLDDCRALTIRNQARPSPWRRNADYERSRPV